MNSSERRKSNGMRVSKWWGHFPFWVNYLFKIPLMALSVTHLDRNAYLESKDVKDKSLKNLGQYT